MKPCIILVVPCRQRINEHTSRKVLLDDFFHADGRQWVCPSSRGALRGACYAVAKAGRTAGNELASLWCGAQGDEGDFRGVEEADEHAGPEAGAGGDVELHAVHLVQAFQIATVVVGDDAGEDGEHAAVGVAGELQCHAAALRHLRGHGGLVREQHHGEPRRRALQRLVEVGGFLMLPRGGGVGHARQNNPLPQLHMGIRQHADAVAGEEIHPVGIAGGVVVVAGHAEHAERGAQIRQRLQIPPVVGHGAVHKVAAYGDGIRAECVHLVHQRAEVGLALHGVGMQIRQQGDGDGPCIRGHAGQGDIQAVHLRHGEGVAHTHGGGDTRQRGKADVDGIAEAAAHEEPADHARQLRKQQQDAQQNHEDVQPGERQQDGGIHLRREVASAGVEPLQDAELERAERQQEQRGHPPCPFRAQRPPAAAARGRGKPHAQGDVEPHGGIDDVDGAHGTILGTPGAKKPANGGLFRVQAIRKITLIFQCVRPALYSFLYSRAGAAAFCVILCRTLSTARGKHPQLLRKT